MFLRGIYSGMEVKEKNVVVAVIQINKGSKNGEGSEAPESTGYKNTYLPSQLMGQHLRDGKRPPGKQIQGLLPL